MDFDSASASRTSTREATEAINCFGCAPTNPIGLQLVFRKCDNTYESRFALNRNYESYPGVIHGGIVATIVDELLSQAVYRECGSSVYTVGLRVRYGQPLQTDAAHLASAEVTHHDDRAIRASARIQNEAGELVAAASGTFCRIPECELDRLRARIPIPQPVSSVLGSSPTST